MQCSKHTLEIAVFFNSRSTMSCKERTIYQALALAFALLNSYCNKCAIIAIIAINAIIAIIQ